MDGSNRHRTLLLLIPLCLAVFIRLYPYFLSGVPWGTDEWPLIRNANALLANSPTALGGNPIFDSYNIYWPGVSLFGSSASLMIGIPPLTTMPVLVPLVASLSTLFFFLIVEKLAKNPFVACIASLFFASAGFDVIFTASATKETFAYPLFMLAILLITMKPTAKSIALFVIASITLDLSHHVTVVILLSILLAVVFAQIAFSLNGYRKLERTWIFPLILVVTFIVYLELYANAGLVSVASGIPISFDSLLPAVAFFFVSIVIAIYFSISDKMRSMLAEGLVLLGASLGLLYLSTRTSILPFAPLLPRLLAVLALPYLLVAFFAIFGYKRMHDAEDRSLFAFVSSWLAAMLALLGYSILGTPSGVNIIYRFFTFVYAPVAIFAGFEIVILLRSKSNFQIVKKGVIILLVLGIIMASGYMSYASVVGKENLLAGHYAYSKSDFVSAQFASAALPANKTLAADGMIGDLYTGYFFINVNSMQGYKYVTGAEPLGANPQDMLVTYSMMSTQGYDLYLYGLPVPSGLIDSLSTNSSLVYNNGNEMIWR